MTALREGEWPRIAGFRVVMSWPQAGCAPPPATPLRARAAGLLGVLLIMAGAAAVGVALGAQVHAPQPSLAAAGAVGPLNGKAYGPSLRRSLPVSVDIPAIGVHSRLLHLGANANGTIRVPSLHTQAGKAAWFKYSATPGQIGASIIEGHVDTGILQIQVPGESRLPHTRIRCPAPDNVRRRFRLLHQKLSQLHCCLRGAGLKTAGCVRRLVPGVDALAHRVVPTWRTRLRNGCCTGKLGGWPSS